jgi:hypothetical protein
MRLYLSPLLVVEPEQSFAHRSPPCRINLAPGNQNSLIRYRPFCNGPDDVKPPGERRAAELMLLSVVNAWPPHHAVRGSGEPI